MDICCDFLCRRLGNLLFLHTRSSLGTSVFVLRNVNSRVAGLLLSLALFVRVAGSLSLFSLPLLPLTSFTVLLSQLLLFQKCFLIHNNNINSYDGNISDIWFHWQFFTRIHHWRNLELAMHRSSPLRVAELKRETSHLTHISRFRIPYK